MKDLRLFRVPRIHFDAVLAETPEQARDWSFALAKADGLEPVECALGEPVESMLELPETWLGDKRPIGQNPDHLTCEEFIKAKAHGGTEKPE